MKKKQKKVLVLNKDYRPLFLISWKKAFLKIYQNKANVVSYYEDFTVQSKHTTHQVPSVIVLKRYVNSEFRKLKSTKNLKKYNIFIRDCFKCQYCGDVFDKKNLTVDHVTPRSKGGKTDYNNLVTSCQPCNAKKGDKLPNQINMFPLNLPRELSRVDFLRFSITQNGVEKDWEPYVEFLFLRT